MDLSDYWQQNKRFVLTVGAGAVTFLVGLAIVDGVYGGELRSLQRTVARAESDLRAPRFAKADLDAAEKRNEELQRALAELGSAVTFQTRQGFALDPAAGSPTNQYFDLVARTRDELLRRARRTSLRTPGDIGLPALSPTQTVEIERYMQAVDLIDRVVNMAMDVGVERIDEIEIRLDPGLGSSRGVGRLERTEVRFRLGGEPLALMRLVLETQSDTRYGAPLQIGSLEMQPERAKSDELRVDVVFWICRLHEVQEEEEA
jgi:hypothetical protein